VALEEAIRRSLEDVDTAKNDSKPEAKVIEKPTMTDGDDEERLEDVKPQAVVVEETEIVVEPETADAVNVRASTEEEEESFSDCKEDHDEEIQAGSDDPWDVDSTCEEDFKKLSPKLSPKKEKSESFTCDATGDIETFVGETLDRMADAIENLQDDDDDEAEPQEEGAKIVEGEEDDELSNASSSWSVVDEEQRIARATEALGSALFNSDLRSSEEQASNNNEEQMSALTHASRDWEEASSSPIANVSSVTSVPSTVRSLENTDVPQALVDRWSDQLNQLHELGFFNDAVSVDVLETLAAANIGCGEDEEPTVQKVIDHLMKDW